MGQYDHELKHIEGTFLEAGIRDPLIMAALVGKLLLAAVRPNAMEGLAKLEAKIHLPATPPNLRVPARLRADASAFFNRHVLVRFAPRGQGIYYPSPRHLTRTIRDLVSARRLGSVADFACGSGGFLVGASRNDRVGIEQRPEWALLAYINVWLASAVPAWIEVGDGSAYAAGHKDQFEAVVSNLHGIDRETELISRSYEAVKPGGSAALVISPEMLQEKAAVPWSDWLKEGALHAVVSLPLNVLQPFAEPKTPPSLLMLQKPMRRLGPAPSDGTVWFVQIFRDGYAHGRGRDVTREPDPLDNDLRVLAPLLGPRGVPVWEAEPIEGPGPGVWVYPLRPDRSQLASGIALSAPSHRIGPIKSVWQPGEKRGLVLGLTDEAGYVSTWLRIGPDGIAEKGDNPDLFFPDAPVLFEGYGPALPLGAQVGVLLNGTVIGVQLSVSHLLSQPQLELSPSRHLQEPQSPLEPENTLQLLAKISEDQRRIRTHLERLLTRVEPPAHWQADLPPGVARLVAPRQLGPKQMQIWQRVRRQTVHGDAGRQVPRHFTVAEVVPKGYDHLLVSQTLELFHKMGLIVAVSMDGMSGYRLISTADLGPSRRGRQSEERT